jgi:sulfide:quinone oxidoreductase
MTRTGSPTTTSHRRREVAAHAQPDSATQAQSERGDNSAPTRHDANTPGSPAATRPDTNTPGNSAPTRPDTNTPGNPAPTRPDTNTPGNPAPTGPDTNRPEHASPAGRGAQKSRVLVAGGGVAALETALALAQLAPERVDVTLIAPNADFAYRPLAVREPFAYGHARRYPLARIAGDAGAELVRAELGWIDPERHTLHTTTGEAFEYDMAMLATGARVTPRYTHALTLDDRRMDEQMHGLIQDVEGGYVQRLAFVAPGRMAWPLPLYELALMTAGRAFEMSVELAITVVTPEESPLAIFGSRASEVVAQRLEKAGIEVIGSAYAEVPAAGELVINPEDRRMQVDRVVALPELYGPCVRGLPLGEHGFVRVDPYGRVREVTDVFAAGDATDFAVKHGGLSSQQADAVAQSIAAQAGAQLTPQAFDPLIRGMLLTGGKPLYMQAHIAGGHGFSSEASETPLWSPVGKISARYLTPYLDALDAERSDVAAGANAGTRA